ncbi:MAG: OmpA/MotB domain protein [Myxococcales bacterium]|nr:OmpA/MotB domain protein [Myxococcales bacterium]
MRYATARCAALLAASLVTLAAVGARADGFDGQRFVPAAGAAGGLQVERPLVPQHLGFGVGLFMNYGYDSVVDRDRPLGITRHVLRHGFTMDFLGSIGLGNIFELAVALPIDAVWTGDASNFNGANLVAGPGVGDLRLVPKMAWWFGRTNLNYGLGFMTPIYFPTGNEDALRSSGGVVIDPVLLASLGGRRWNFALNAGFKARTNGKNPDFTGGKELHWGLAGTFGLVAGKLGLDLIVELVGGWQPDALGPGSIKVPLETDAALVIKPGREWSIYLGGAAGLDNGLATPDGRAIVGVRYAHRVPGSDRYQDSDHDGIINGKDQCPDAAEDFDGFEDDDGCPEADNDHDGVPDDDDECPDQAGPRANDGCPEHGVVVWRHGRLIIFGKVQFDTGSARIQRRSGALLDQIAVMVKEHPEVGRIRVEGYTDNVGPPDMNLRLSRERADSVKEALIQRGVPRDRLRTEGYGEAHPIAPNRTRAGRAKNRRVEFVATR